MPLEMTKPFTTPGEMSLSYKFFRHFCYWEMCIHFLGGGEGTNFLLGDLPQGKFSMGREVS